MTQFFVFFFSQPMRVDQGILDMGLCKSVPPSRRNTTVEKKERSARAASSGDDPRLLEYKKILEEYDKLILLRAGDVEEHPGPRKNGNFYSTGVVHVRYDNPSFPDNVISGFTEDHIFSFNNSSVDGASLDMITQFSSPIIRNRTTYYVEFSAMPETTDTINVERYSLHSGELFVDIVPEGGYYSEGSYEFSLSAIYFDDGVEKTACEYVELSRHRLVDKNCGSHRKRFLHFGGFDLTYRINDPVGCCPVREFFLKIVVNPSSIVSFNATLNRKYRVAYLKD